MGRGLSATFGAVAMGLSVFASPAMAVAPPGPPPWNCFAAAACEDGDCTKLVNTPASFQLHEHADTKDAFLATGASGEERLAIRFQSFDLAREALSSEDLPRRTSLILVPSDTVVDAHGFDVWNVMIRGTGERILTPHSLLIVCNSIRAQ